VFVRRLSHRDVETGAPVSTARPETPNEEEPMTVMTAEAAVRTVLDERAAALRTKDADRLAACHLPGGVAYDLAPPLAKTFDVEETRAWFADKGGTEMDYELRDVEILVGGDVAVAYGLTRLGDGATFELWYRTTLALREVDGHWLVAHLHESTPFHMDGTNRAALDLHP
jgi:ketosteroid isomerase-like protein